MKISQPNKHLVRSFCIVLSATIAFTTSLQASEPAPLLDDFSADALTNYGTPRIVINDASIGGTSSAQTVAQDGVLHVKGQLKPSRGQPAFVSLALLTAPDGSPVDLSAYQGIRLRVSVLKGTLSLQIASTEVQNFDYHSIALSRDGKGLQEIRIPFQDLKRIWSQQTALNLATITSINLVASSLQPGSFAYAIDEVSFY